MRTKKNAVQVVTCLFEKGGMILMNWRGGDEPNYGNGWAFPAGEIEKDETPSQAVTREMREELGVRIENCKPLGIIDDIDPTSGRLFSHNVFLVESWSGEITGSSESDIVEWFSLDLMVKLNTFPVTFKILECAGRRARHI